MALPVIQTNKLGLKIGNNFILKDIDWTIYPGEHWVIFGSNGCGKTTLLSLIAGFQSPTHGELTFLGDTFTKDNLLALRQKIGFVSSSFLSHYYSTEAVLDIVLSGVSATLGLPYEVGIPQIKKAKEFLREFRLQQVVSHPFHTLSNGQRQQVLIARALMNNPQVLILDEPCAGLDIFSRAYLLELIHDLATKTKLTLLFVTHYPDEMADVFEHCLLLQGGKVFAQGITKDTFTSENVTKLVNYPLKVTWQNQEPQLEIRLRTAVDKWQSQGFLG